MADIGVTPLAQVRHLCFEKWGPGRAVRCVAGKTVFDHRGVIPEKRTSQICVALKALLVHELSVYQFVGCCPMGIMAVGALDFSLPYRMVRLPCEVSPDVYVAAGTYPDLIRGRTGLRQAFVDAMTIRA